MTRQTSARVAGFMYLFYTAVGSTLHLLMNRATNAQGTAATLALIASHAFDVRLSVVLSLLESFSALVLAVSLYKITRDEDHELAMLALLCRVCEGTIGAAFGVPSKLRMVWLATGGPGAPTLDAATRKALGEFVVMPVSSIPIGTIFFAVASMLFSFLLLRGRLVPVALAWSGIVASMLLVAVLPLQIAGFVEGPWYLWIPMAVFQIVLAIWLLVRGVAPVELPGGPRS